MRIRHASFTPVRMMSACHGVPPRRTLMSTRKIVVKDTLLLRYTHTAVLRARSTQYYTAHKHIYVAANANGRRRRNGSIGLYISQTPFYIISRANGPKAQLRSQQLLNRLNGGRLYGLLFQGKDDLEVSNDGRRYVYTRNYICKLSNQKICAASARMSDSRMQAFLRTRYKQVKQTSVFAKGMLFSMKTFSEIMP